MKPLLDYLLSLNYRGEVRRSDLITTSWCCAYIGKKKQPSDFSYYTLIT